MIQSPPSHSKHWRSRRCSESYYKSSWSSEDPHPYVTNKLLWLKKMLSSTLMTLTVCMDTFNPWQMWRTLTQPNQLTTIWSYIELLCSWRSPKLDGQLSQIIWQIRTCYIMVTGLCLWTQNIYINDAEFWQYLSVFISLLQVLSQYPSLEYLSWWYMFIPTTLLRSRATSFPIFYV